MSEIYCSSDIWLCAFLYAESNAQLLDIQKSRHGSEIMFRLKGEELSHLADAYCKEEARANVTELRAKLNLFRDLIFNQRTSKGRKRR